MTDVFAPAERSRIMARVRQRHTHPELVVRRVLTSMGIRYRLHRKDLPSCPDIVIPSRRLAVLVHGCFWHGHTDCRRGARPTTNIDFWIRKIASNVARDERDKQSLKAAGWDVLVVWECQTRREESLKKLLASRLEQQGGRAR